MMVFDVGDDFSDSSFSRGEDDKNHGKKIQQTSREEDSTNIKHSFLIYKIGLNNRV